MAKPKVEREGEDALQVLTVRLPVWLHRALKVKTAQEGQKMQDVALKMFSDYVGGKPAGPRHRPKGIA